MQSFPQKIRVDVERQRMELLETDDTTGETRLLAEFPVSTSGFGLGTEPGSYKTPTGKFRIGEKIGEDAPLGAVFKSRLLTGEIGPLEAPESRDDLVQTRILWLEGAEPHNANTKERYIYIHGTNHEETIGEPCSHGCIRMRNKDIIDLFARVEPGTEVAIDKNLA